MLLRTLALGFLVAHAAAMGNHGDACNPTPCGPNTDCTTNGNGIAICRCKPGYFPKPDTVTGCGPQCTSDFECNSNQQCAGTRCVNPCDSSPCGINAICEVRNHRAICRCVTGYSGDPFTRCSAETNGRIITGGGSSSSFSGSGSSFISSSGSSSSSSSSFANNFLSRDTSDYCASFTCGTNANCLVRSLRPVCVCRSGYQGDPYTGCRRAECLENSECPSNRVCHNFKCIDPCSTSCGVDADCDVRNHVTVCRCPAGYSGDPFVSCSRRSSTSVGSRQSINQDYCNPTPCGPNTKCRTENGRAVCSCLDNYIGDPIQGCRRECDTDADCSLDKGCINFRCQDPCTSCGTYADCRVQNHRAVCSCPANYLGDPYTRCYPECTQHEECPTNKACFNLKCVDPCIDACGINAECRVQNHKAVCSCPKDYTGHPFDRCRPFDASDLCNPNPCGVDAICKPGKDRDNKDRPVCLCKVGYIGDPLTSCRRGQCIDHEDCASNQACYGYECVDPCSSSASGGSVCGTNARCDARNHGAVCSCRPGYSGDPLTECRPSNRRF